MRHEIIEQCGICISVLKAAMIVVFHPCEVHASSDHGLCAYR
jgi:hypothetical protein